MISRQRKDFPVGIQRLFFDRYACIVPAISLKSIQEIRTRGVHAMVEDEEENRKIHYNPVETSLSINSLFEIWRQGFEPQILDRSKTLEIFNAITDHLSQWVNYLSYGVQIPETPFEDLLALDAFADKVYAHARHERVKRNINYFTTFFKNDLGFNLSPTNQLATAIHYRPLGDTSGMIFDPKMIAKEDRVSFSEELTRLGGRHSRAMQMNEREALFARVNVPEGKKEGK